MFNSQNAKVHFQKKTSDHLRYLFAVRLSDYQLLKRWLEEARGNFPPPGGSDALSNRSDGQSTLSDLHSAWDHKESMNKSNLDVTPPVGRRAAATAGACGVAPALFAMHKHLEHGSKRYFRQAGAIFFPFLLFTGLWPPPLSPSSPPSVFPLFFGRVFFSRRHLLQIVLSLSWLAGTPLGGGQSPPEWEENTHMHAHLRRWTHVIKRKHGHAQRHITHTHTHATQEGADEGTHFQSPPASGLPTLHLINPLWEPDKAGEGTQQPLNTWAGCIRRVRWIRFPQQEKKKKKKPARSCAT